MSAWVADIIAFLVLCIGARAGRPRAVRGLCALGTIYLVFFSIAYYIWLSGAYHRFKTHPGMLHVGIVSAFAFEHFWTLFGNMLLVQGVIPLALVFLVYFAVKWLNIPLRPGSPSSSR